MTTQAKGIVNVDLIYFPNAKQLYAPSGLTPATQQAVGVDLRACNTEESISNAPGERRNVPTGVGIEPRAPGIAGFVYSRSGLGAKVGLTVAQGVGIIDPDYRGEITIYMLNTSTSTQTISRGERIAQLVMQPYITPAFHEVEALSQTERGHGGYGHTGDK